MKLAAFLTHIRGDVKRFTRNFLRATVPLRENSAQKTVLSSHETLLFHRKPTRFHRQTPLFHRLPPMYCTHTAYACEHTADVCRRTPEFRAQTVLLSARPILFHDLPRADYSSPPAPIPALQLAGISKTIYLYLYSRQKHAGNRGKGVACGKPGFFACALSFLLLSATDDGSAPDRSTRG